MSSFVFVVIAIITKLLSTLLTFIGLLSSVGPHMNSQTSTMFVTFVAL